MDQTDHSALATNAPSPAQAEISDEQVVDRVRGGDTDAFGLLMRRHNQRLYRAVRSILRDEAEAEDVLQETYVRAFTHLDQFLGRARFSTWLTRIAVNEALHRRKRRARLSDIDDVVDRLASPSPGPEHETAHGELRRLLEASIDCLADEFRTVFVLRDVEGLSTAETADSLEIPVETVKTRLHRARRQLQQHLNRAMGDSAQEVYAFGFQRCDRLVAAVMERIGGGERAAGDATPDRPEPWSAPGFFRTLVEDSPDAIVVADRRGVIRLWNAAAQQLFGYTAAEAVGRSLDLIIPEKLRDRHWTGYDAVMRSGTSRYGLELLKVPALHRDGRRLSVEFRIALLRDDAGEVAGVGAFLRDATEAWTERKQLLERIEALERDRSKA
ncbi:MAG TPA: RNA polymerase sigma factor [Candidatus Dormibacteraeota bacterium]|nr:RNA polymerase sigma factor [Candidatus Dormibacteraeota bacterium]